MLMPMNLMADDYTLLSVTVGASSGGNDGEGANNAFDGIATNKWCGDITSVTLPFVEVQLTKKSKLDCYYLYTGNDINYEDAIGKQQRNPKEWKLYAKVNESDNWTLISHVTDAGLPTTASTRSKDYWIDEAYKNIEYNYFRFEILGTEQGNIYEVGEICLVGCAHQYASNSAICSICGKIKEHTHTFNNSGYCIYCGEKEQFPISLDFLRGVPSENADETAAFAFDDNTTNKWCGKISNGNPYALLRHDCMANIKRYYFYTGNDIHPGDEMSGYQNRNPKEWKLYAKQKINDPWTMISHVIDAKLPSTNSTRSSYYFVDDAYQEEYYKYFKFELINIGDQPEKFDKIFEIGELCFEGGNIYHDNDYYSGGICTICGDKQNHQHNYVNGVCTQCNVYESITAGNGTANDPYLIGNAGQLGLFRDMTGNVGSHICGKLTADIDMAVLCNETIGSWLPFYGYHGTFDGDGHVLKNLYINDDRSMVGFCSYSEGTIKNLGIESGNITGTNIVGAICGKVYNANIINCHNNASVTFKNGQATAGPVQAAGGICGYMDVSHIENCYNSGAVSGSHWIGGISGDLGTGHIKNCYNTGNISGENGIGGITGHINWYYAYVINCFNTGKVTGETNTCGIIGEIATSTEQMTLNNNYYLQTEGISGGLSAIGKTAEQFASGEVAWLLNGSMDGEGNWTAGKTDGSQLWYQKIGTDTHPTLQKAEGSTVFTDCMNSNKSYGNTVVHNCGELTEAIKPTCTEDGNIAYHQCTDCNKYFDEEGNELAEGEWVRPAAHTFGSDDICTECGYKKLSHLSFTIEESLGGFNTEGPDKAIDGTTTNKWCGNFSKGNPYIVLKNDGKAKLVNYHLYTGNDIVNSGNNRNPKEWILYAKEKSSDEWTEISHVTDAQLTTEKSARSNDYTIAENLQDTYYKFFKFEIIRVEKGDINGDIYEVGELCLMGYPCHHQYDGESVFCSICGDIKEHEHIYGDGIVTKEPTCTVSGEKKHICLRCEETETEEISPLGHTINDDLKCTVCGHDVGADCVIEYTATEKLSFIMEDREDGKEIAYDYTDNIPDREDNFGEILFGATAIKHEYDVTTQKGRIICSTPVLWIQFYTILRPDRLTSITLPSTAGYVYGGAFFNNRNLTSITLLAECSNVLEYDLNFEGCNNLQEIIVPYNSYAEYVEACTYEEFSSSYEDENGVEHIVDTKDLLKSLLSLDDTKTFENPTSEVKADVTLQRSFANDGWYSLCLPFSVSVADSPFAQVAVFNELDGDTYRFTTVDNIEAGKAYIVKVNEAVANPTFKNVMISTAAPASDGDFIGVYSPTELGEGCKVIGSGTTVNPVNPGMMKGFRAYFKPSQTNAKAMRFTVDDGEATVVQSPIETEGYKLKAKGTFNLAGQKVNENYRGIVIKNGKKLLRK